MTTLTRRPITAAVSDRWEDFAACRTVDPDLFFPDGRGAVRVAQEEAAKAVCRNVCLVRQQCLRQALDTRQTEGVWGGLDEKERRRLLRRSMRASQNRDVPAVDQIIREQLDDYLKAVDAGLSTWEIAKALRTNTQTVNNVARALLARQEVRA
ncbi:WhiB family transcriptional regulator [Streptomyces sp. NPDC015346]|uniref:WhiB family transcriptional regulator n=1 Tax=Streptomyces sp. NPDC015346 TaxID=3364954 RepID=UPI0036FD6F3B